MTTPTQEIRLADVTELQKPDPWEYDALIVDPPYSPHVHRKAVSQSKGGGVRSRDFGFGHLTPKLREAVAFWAAHVRRWSVIYSDIEGLHDWRQAGARHGATFVRHIPWVRWSMPQLSGDRPPSGCEMVTIYWGADRGKKSWAGPGNLTHLSHTCLRGAMKHKAEKPLDQILDLVSWFTRPGDRVVDLGAGSGVIGLACRILGRSYVGYEVDEKWADFAARRIATQTLSKRDQDRYARWMASREAEAGAAARRRGRHGNDARLSLPG